MAYTKTDIKNQLRELGVQKDDTVLVHSSMKAIGEVEDRADAVLDAFIEYLSDGLLIFPTHTWAIKNTTSSIRPPSHPVLATCLTSL